VSLVDDAVRALVIALQSADVQPPDLIGADLTHNGEVVGMIELGWSEPHIAVCLHSFEVPGWELILMDPNDGTALTELVATIIQKLEG